MLRYPEADEIKSAIRFKPWGKLVWFYHKDLKKICTGKLLGFQAGENEDDDIIKYWSVQYNNESTKIVQVKDGHLFMSEGQALRWAMTHTDLGNVIEK